MNKSVWFFFIVYPTLVSCSEAKEHMSAEHFLENVTEHLMHDIMRIWSIVNTAHAICPEDNAQLNNEIFDASLELYGKIYCALLHGYKEPYYIGTVHNMLNALQHNHDMLCNQQSEFDSSTIRRLMHSVYLLDQKLYNACTS